MRIYTVFGASHEETADGSRLAAAGRRSGADTPCATAPTCAGEGQRKSGRASSIGSWGRRNDELIGFVILSGLEKRPHNFTGVGMVADIQ